MSFFNSPLLLGFDHFERVLDRVSKAQADGYPPYNVEQRDDNSLRLTLAVAGFAGDDLAVQIEDNQLVIRGRQKEDPERVYLHRGIAARQFQRSFLLADGIEVRAASLDNGLLHIDLIRTPPETKIRTVEIKSSGKRDTAERNQPKAEASNRHAMADYKTKFGDKIGVTKVTGDNSGS